MVEGDAGGDGHVTEVRNLEASQYTKRPQGHKLSLDICDQVWDKWQHSMLQGETFHTWIFPDIWT